MLSTSSNETFTGWACAAKGEPLEKMELPLRTWDENCVDMDVICCGMCGTDIHTLDESFGPGTSWPCVVGHEIAGKVTRVGKNVTNVRVGDRAGVGCQADSCGKCEECLKGNQNLCTVRIVMTYNDTWFNGDKTFGGYGSKFRGDYRFIFKVPDSMPSEIAASFFCSGLTVYAPMKRLNVNSKSVVGVVGIGGLGHYPF
ncbi:hypothetical protein G6F42_012834 [Rhizopus arrhizus]|nr:hypothetical protein G6F42_012834 [Rhizopus arrhizus]